MKFKKYLLAAFSGAVIFSSCSREDENKVSESDKINDFVWKGLNSWYYWQKDVPALADNAFKTTACSRHIFLKIVVGKGYWLHGPVVGFIALISIQKICGRSIIQSNGAYEFSICLTTDCHNIDVGSQPGNRKFAGRSRTV